MRAARAFGRAAARATRAVGWAPVNATCAIGRRAARVANFLGWRRKPCSVTEGMPMDPEKEEREYYIRWVEKFGRGGSTEFLQNIAATI